MEGNATDLRDPLALRPPTPSRQAGELGIPLRKFEPCRGHEQPGELTPLH
jgi:hypothetical protein